MEIHTQAYRQLYGAAGIPLCIVRDGQAVLALPEREAPVFTPHFIALCLTDFAVYSRSHTGPMLVYLGPGYYLAAAQLDEAHTLILGPGQLARFGWAEVLPWLDAPLYNDNRPGMGRLLMRQTPVTAVQFVSALSLALYLHTGRCEDFSALAVADTAALRYPVRPTLTQYIFDAREGAEFHTPHWLEEEMTGAVEKGDMHRLNDIICRGAEGRLGVLSPNEDREQRYMFVTVAAVSSRAAMRGGVDCEIAYSMADVYCQRMDAMTGAGDIQQLQLQMIQAFCQEVAKRKNDAHSPAVRSCCGYIWQHTHEKITLEDLSACCGMSTRRLSEKFRREMGMPVVDYIHRIKLEEAELLLRESDYSLGEISCDLGYSSQSHFIAVFRRLYGITPMQYREGTAPSVQK